MSSPRTAKALADLARDVDLLVFRLEQPAPGGDPSGAERETVRRELERIRDQLVDLAATLEG